MGVWGLRSPSTSDMTDHRNGPCRLLLEVGNWKQTVMEEPKMSELGKKSKFDLSKEQSLEKGMRREGHPLFSHPEWPEKKLSPESRLLVADLRVAAALDQPELSGLPEGVRNPVIAAVKEMPAYREAAEELGKMPKVSEAFVRDVLPRILAIDQKRAPLDGIPVESQRTVARAVGEVADLAAGPGATAKDTADAESLSCSLLGVDPPLRHQFWAGFEKRAWIAEVRQEVAPYLKTAAVERPIRADDTPGWDLVVSMMSIGLVGPGEAAKAFTATVLEQSETTKPAAAFFDLSGTVYGALKAHSAKVAYARLEEKAATTRAYLLKRHFT